MMRDIMSRVSSGRLMTTLRYSSKMSTQREQDATEKYVLSSITACLLAFASLPSPCAPAPGLGSVLLSSQAAGLLTALSRIRVIVLCVDAETSAGDHCSFSTRRAASFRFF